MAPISFARGAPSPDCLPVAELADCARAALEHDGDAALAYGAPGGYGPLREWLAERHRVSAGRILLTNGGLQGLHFVVRALLERRWGRVLVEAPTYDRTLTILQQLGADVVALPMDEEGLAVESLEEELARSGGAPSFLYTIPTFQNPSGRTLGVERRRRLVELAAEHDLAVLEDDPYGLVRFEGEPPPLLHELAPDRVVYGSSFSKTVAPGVRVGYFVLPAELVAPVEAAAVSTYISPVLLGQATVWELIRRGSFEPNLERVRTLLRARRDAMLAALDAELAGAATWSRPAGGYFLWLELTDDVDADVLRTRAGAAGVAFVSGADFFPRRAGGRSSARLAYSYEKPAAIAEGIARLAALVPAAATVS